MLKPMIVFLTDLSEESLAPVPQLADLTRRLDGRIAALHVVTHGELVASGDPLAPVVPLPDHREQVAEARVWLEKLKPRFGGLEVSVEVEVARDPADAAARFADKSHAAFIALATHGRSGFERFALGSVAESVLRRSKVPVVVFPLRDAGLGHAR
jgi:nucleotide-binding universal stress UspA family protein